MTTKSDAADRYADLSDLEREFVTMKREIAVAGREQGADPDSNLWLRLAIHRAENSKMPEPELEEAVEWAKDPSSAPEFAYVTYEGYGPFDVAVFVEAITDDRAATTEALNQLFEDAGGNIGEDGCVAWQFERRGRIDVVAEDVDDGDAFMMEVVELGAEDLQEPLYEPGESDRTPVYRVYTEPNEVWTVAERLEEAGYRIHDAYRPREATQTKGLDRDQARDFIQFYETVNTHPDVQAVYSNWERA